MDANTYDYIVVGAGSAGAVVANRLSASGEFNVLCLEVGTEGSGYLWSRIPAGVAKLIDIAESMGTDELTIARMRKGLEDTPSTLKLLKN